MLDPCADLRAFAMFDGLSAADLAELRAHMTAETYTAGVRLFERGEAGGTLLLICAGTVEVLLRDETGQEIVFRTLGAGSVLGEFSLLDQRPRSASVCAAVAVTVLVLERGAFLAFLNTHPLAGLALMRTLAERIRYTTAYLEALHEAVERLQAGDDHAHAPLLITPAAPDHMSIDQLIDNFIALARRVRDQQKKPRSGGL